MSSASLQYFKRVQSGDQALYLDEFSRAFRDVYVSSLNLEHGASDCMLRIQVAGRDYLKAIIRSGFQLQFFNTENYVSHFIHSLNAIFASPCRMIAPLNSDRSTERFGYRFVCFVNGAPSSAIEAMGLDLDYWFARDLSPIITDAEISRRRQFIREFYDPDSIPSSASSSSNTHGLRGVFVFQNYDDLIAAMDRFWEQVYLVTKFLRTAYPGEEVRLVLFSDSIDISGTLEVNLVAESDRKFRKAKLDLHLFDNNAITSRLLPMDVWSHVCSYLGTESETPEILHRRRPLPPSLQNDFQTRASIRKSKTVIGWSGSAVGRAGNPAYYPVAPTYPQWETAAPVPGSKETDIMETADGGRKQRRYVSISRSKAGQNSSRPRKPHTKSQLSRSRSRR